MGMGIRTYIPQILAFANWFKRYVASHAETLKQHLGDGGYAVLQLILDLVIVFATMVEAVRDPVEPWSDFAGIATVNSSQLNEIQGAIAKFYDTIGVTP
jgi:hypothetical protein